MLISRDLDEKTLQRMFLLYCRKHHNSISLCESCKSLLDYSLQRTKECKWKQQGRLCSNCDVHCFKESKRVEIRRIMKFAGPRLILSNPLLALRYLLLKSMQGRIIR